MSQASDGNDGHDELTQDSLLRVLDSLKRSLDQAEESTGQPARPSTAAAPIPEFTEPVADVPLLDDIVLPDDELDETSDDLADQRLESPHHPAPLMPSGHWVDYLATKLRVELAEEIDAVVREALKTASPRIEACIRKRVEKMLPVIVADALRRSRDKSV